MLSHLKFPCLGLLTVLVFLCVHESGHAVAAYLTGGWVTEVSIFSFRPHVRIEGTATAMQSMFRASAGTGFSLLAVVLLTWLTPPRQFTMQLVRVVASCFLEAELIGWTSSALWGSSGRDDASLFLEITGFNPYWTAAICAAIALLLAAALVRTRWFVD